MGSQVEMASPGITPQNFLQARAALMQTWYNNTTKEIYYANHPINQASAIPIVDYQA